MTGFKGCGAGRPTALTTGVQMDWLLVAQAAQGVRHMRLLKVADECQPETHRQSKWAEGQLRSHATQILVS